MPDFNCIFTEADVMHLSEAVTELGLSLVDDCRYEKKKLSSVTVRDLFSFAPYAHGAYAYSRGDISNIEMSKIRRKDAADRFFFIVDDLSVPEHLRISVFLKNREHAGTFGVSHQAQFLSAGSTLAKPSEELKKRYRRLRTAIARSAVRVLAGGQAYYVAKGAIVELRRGRVATTFGSQFDKRLVESLPKG